METQTIIIISFSAACAALLLLIVALYLRVRSLARTVALMQATGRIRVQKLKMKPDSNHSFHNPALSPDEELSRRGFSLYSGDPERGEAPRQTGGQWVESAPPFLLQSIEENKRKGQSSPPPRARQSDTNPNFIY